MKRLFEIHGFARLWVIPREDKEGGENTQYSKNWYILTDLAKKGLLVNKNVDRMPEIF